MVDIMATREELYRKFGPILVDAVTQVLKDEINILREAVGLPKRTNAQVVDAIAAKLETIPMYDWMN
jgi:hypothetical protein